MSSNPTVSTDPYLPYVGFEGSLSFNNNIKIDGTTPYIIGTDLRHTDGSFGTIVPRCVKRQRTNRGDLPTIIPFMSTLHPPPSALHPPPSTLCPPPVTRHPSPFAPTGQSMPPNLRPLNRRNANHPGEILNTGDVAEIEVEFSTAVEVSGGPASN